MQVCKGRCSAMKVPFRPYKNMYLEHVWCSCCDAYFKKPHPQYCLCCVTRVRNTPRLTRRHKTYNLIPPKAKGVKFVQKEILAAVEAGRL